MAGQGGVVGAFPGACTCISMEECGGCNTAESKLAYKVRLGLEAPSQGVDKRVRQRAANTAKAQQGGEPLVVDGAGAGL